MTAFRSVVPSRFPTRPELAVLVSGTTSMGLEILAGRIVAPEFGSSIYTWGSIIGVFLAALSLGYHRGGRRAAREASLGKLTSLLVGAAVYVAFLVLAGDLLLQATDQLPLPARLAPLAPIVVLFAPPVYLLGYISPYAAELSDTDDVGRASGHVYALGTVGSIVGAFGTTFLLVPSLSVELIGGLFGGILVVAAAYMGRGSLPVDAQAGVVVAAITVLVAASVGPVGAGITGEVVYETQTPYQELAVVDDGDTRTLYLDGQPHSAMYLDDPYAHAFDYTRYFHVPLLMTGDVDRVLFVGGGGFTGPRIFHHEYPNVTVDVVEIDPVVVDVAREYFRVPDSPRMNVHVGDGREFLEETDREYDLIVLDAYKKDKVPFHMTTVEFMRLASDRLDSDGVLVANVISAPTGPASQFFRAEYRTMEQVFPEVYAFTTAGPGVVQNIELVATKRDGRLGVEELLARNREREIGYNLSREVRTLMSDVETGDVPVLRDDRAPVDQLLDPLQGRRYVVESSGRNGTDGDGTGATVGPALLPAAAVARRRGRDGVTGPPALEPTP